MGLVAKIRHFQRQDVVFMHIFYCASPIQHRPRTAQVYIVTLPPCYNRKDKGQDDTDEYRGSEREIKDKIPFLYVDVTRESPDIRYLTSKDEYQTKDDKEEPYKQKELTKIKETSHKNNNIKGLEY